LGRILETKKYKNGNEVAPKQKKQRFWARKKDQPKEKSEEKVEKKTFKQKVKGIFKKKEKKLDVSEKEKSNKPNSN
jgi:hypothetical protein